MIMYAVLSSGGKQYRVEAGTTLMLERLDGQAGATVTFDRVLLIGDGDDVTIGTPTVAGASVSATVLGEALGPKLVIFKFKQKVKYRRRTGHRQHMTRVRIDAINPTEASKSAPAAKPAAKAKAEPAEAPAEAASAAPPRAIRARAKKAAATPSAEPVSAEPAARKPKAPRAAKPKAEE
jgi:large subunit ribosomal protein L21